MSGQNPSVAVMKANDKHTRKPKRWLLRKQTLYDFHIRRTFSGDYLCYAMSVLNIGYRCKHSEWNRLFKGNQKAVQGSNQLEFSKLKKKIEIQPGQLRYGVKYKVRMVTLLKHLCYVHCH